MTSTHAALRLQALSDKLFTADVLDLVFTSIPYPPCQQEPDAEGVKIKKIGTLSELQHHLAHANQPHKTSTQDILIIHQNHSWSKLQITAAAFDAVVASAQASPLLHELAATFGIKTSDDERCFHGIRSCSPSGKCSGQVHEVGYVLPYVERHGRDLKDPWSMRRLGVYHQTTTGGRSQWVMFGLKTHTERHLGPMLEESATALPQYTLHEKMLTRLDQNWAQYIDHLSQELSLYNDKATYTSAADESKSGYTVAPADLQGLHILEAKIARASAAVQTCLLVSEGLASHMRTHDTAGTTTEATQGLRARQQQHLQGVQHELSQLHSRLGSTLRLLTNILACQNSALLHSSNSAATHALHALLEIAAQTRTQQQTLHTILGTTQADSSMLKGLAVVATVCLPASLVATIFSSNLILSVPIVDTTTTTTSSSNTRLVCAPQFWIYLAVTIPLMGATLVWILLWGRRAGGRWKRGVGRGGWWGGVCWWKEKGRGIGKGKGDAAGGEGCEMYV